MRYIIILLLTSFAFRFYQLGTVPVSLAHDEVDNIIQAHAFIHTGSDIVGTWSPWQMLPNSGVMSEWGPLINTLSAKFLPTSLFSAHLTTAILSTLYPVLVWVLLQKLGASRRVANFAGILIAISPWHILFSRTVLEQPTSLFFYTLSWILLTQIYQKQSKGKLIFSILGFSLSYAFGFFTYHGYKFSLPVLTLIFSAYYYLISKPRKLIYLFPFVLVFALLGYVYLNRSHYSSRGSEMVFNQSEEAAKAVDFERRQSLAPEWSKKLFSNKITFIGDQVLENYLNLYNPETLFLHGEANGVFSVWKNGYLLLILAPFLIIGAGELIRLWRPTEQLILTLLLASPLTSVIHIGDASYSFRSAFSLILLHIIAAYGLSSFIARISKSNLWKAIVLPLIFLLSVAGLGYFCYIYYFLSPVTNANAYFFGDRLMANYVRLNQSKKILVLDPQPRYSYSQIILARGRVTADDITSFKNQFSPAEGDVYEIPNLIVARNCKDIVNMSEFDAVVVNKNLLPDLTLCPAFNQIIAPFAKLKSRSLVSPQDSGEERRIYGDSMCDSSILNTYVHPTTIHDFALESMSANDFCAKWVVVQ